MRQMAHNPGKPRYIPPQELQVDRGTLSRILDRGFGISVKAAAIRIPTDESSQPSLCNTTPTTTNKPDWSSTVWTESRLLLVIQLLLFLPVSPLKRYKSPIVAIWKVYNNVEEARTAEISNARYVVPINLRVVTTSAGICFQGGQQFRSPFCGGRGL